MVLARWISGISHKHCPSLSADLFRSQSELVDIVVGLTNPILPIEIVIEACRVVQAASTCEPPAMIRVAS